MVIHVNLFSFRHRWRAECFRELIRAPPLSMAVQFRHPHDNRYCLKRKRDREVCDSGIPGNTWQSQCDSRLLVGWRGDHPDTTRSGYIYVEICQHILPRRKINSDLQQPHPRAIGIVDRSDCPVRLTCIITSIACPMGNLNRHFTCIGRCEQHTLYPCRRILQ